MVKKSNANKVINKRINGNVKIVDLLGLNWGGIAVECSGDVVKVFFSFIAFDPLN
jgi:hypothetical protein